MCLRGMCVSMIHLEVLLSQEENRDLHRRCVEQYDHLRDEFERYKLRAQSVLKNKSSPSPKVCFSFIIVWYFCWHLMVQIACDKYLNHTKKLCSASLCCGQTCGDRKCIDVISLRHFKRGLDVFNIIISNKLKSDSYCCLWIVIFIAELQKHFSNFGYCLNEAELNTYILLY